MKTLADEIEDFLPGMYADLGGPVPLAPFADALSARMDEVRRAAAQLGDEGRAHYFRRKGSRLLLLAPLGALGRRERVCAHCRLLFDPGKAKRRCCTRSCAVKWSWTNPETKAARTAGILAERATPEARARAAAINNARWAKPGAREKLAKQSAERWADPAMRAVMSTGIQAVNGSPKMRAHASAVRTEAWAKPEVREKMVAGIRRTRKSPEHRAKQSVEMKRRWADPEMREKYLAATKINSAKAADAVRGQIRDILDWIARQSR